jgi:Tfp pilus assembly protein PilX
MLLNRILARGRSDDGGFALAAVLGVMLVVALLSVTVLTVSVSSTAFSTSTRASVQSRAAAQSGIDAAWASVSTGSFPCSVSSTDPAFSATLTYSDGSGATLPCSGTASGTPATAKVVSVGTAGSRGVGASDGDRATANAVFTITVTTTGAALGYAIFSDSGFALKNKVSLNDSTDGTDDASLYSNGTVTCSTQLDIQGSITVQGDVTFSDTCTTLGTVWSGGNVTLGNSSSLDGDVYAAGTGTMTLANSSHVGGSVITNGAVVMSDGSGVTTCPSSATSSAVCGTVAALGGGIATSNGATIGGSAYARDGISLTGSGNTASPLVGGDLVATSGGLGASQTPSVAIGGSVRVGTTVSGVTSSNVGNAVGSCQGGTTSPFARCTGALTIPAPNPASALPATLGYPTTSMVNKPPREQLPQIASSASALTAWTGWTKRVFSGATACSDAMSFLGGPWSGAQLLVVSGCPGPLTWGNNSTLSLKGDLAIMSATGFDASQNIVVGSADGASHQLEWIVPSDAPGISWNAVAGTSPTQYTPSCNPAPGPSITTGGGNTTVNDGVRWFMYSPCTVSIGGSVTGFKGQIYGGTVTYPNNSGLQFAQVSVPGAAYPNGQQPTTTTSAVVSSRYAG